MKIRVFSAIGACVLVTVLGFIPFENMVYSFPTAEKAFCYFYSEYEEENITFSVEGENSKLIIAQNSKGGTMGIMTKSDDKWKIGYSTELKVVGEHYGKSEFATIYEHRPTGDIYICIVPTSNEELSINDDYNTEFKLCPADKENTLPAYYGYIPNLPDNYEVEINGEKVMFDK